MDDAIIVPIDPKIKDKANEILKEYGTDVNHLVEDIVVNIAATDGSKVSFEARNDTNHSPFHANDEASEKTARSGHIHIEVILAKEANDIPNEETRAAIRESLAHTGKKFVSMEALMADLNADD